MHSYYTGEYSALIAGGYRSISNRRLKDSEVVPQEGSICTPSVPKLPTYISYQPSLMLTQDHKIIICGGSFNEKRCLEMVSNTWVQHSSLNQKRRCASAISMESGSFFFGGIDSKATWEWLPSGSSKWIPGNSSIPVPGIKRGCAVKISQNEIALIGGRESPRKLISYNTKTGQWKNYGNILKEGRSGHACVLFNEKIFVVGGNSEADYFNSTEVIDLRDLTISTLSGNLIQRRANHGLAVVHVGNNRTVIAMGGIEEGVDLDSIEAWDETTGKWTMLDMKISLAKSAFAYLSVPHLLICSLT